MFIIWVPFSLSITKYESMKKSKLTIKVIKMILLINSAYCKDAQLAIYDGFESLSFDPKKPKQYCGDLTYYKNVEDKVMLSASNRLLIRYTFNYNK